ERSIQGGALDPSPVAVIVAGAVLGIDLRCAIELRAAGQFTEHFFRQRLLRWGARGVLLARNHDHSQLDLFLAGEFFVMLPVVTFDFRGRNNRARLDVMTAHGLHHYSFQFLRLTLAQRTTLLLELPAASAPACANGSLHATVL